MDLEHLAIPKSQKVFPKIIGTHGTKGLHWSMWQIRWLAVRFVFSYLVLIIVPCHSSLAEATLLSSQTHLGLAVSRIPRWHFLPGKGFAWICFIFYVCSFATLFCCVCSPPWILIKSSSSGQLLSLSMYSLISMCVTYRHAITPYPRICKHKTFISISCPSQTLKGIFYFKRPKLRDQLEDPNSQRWYNLSIKNNNYSYRL